MGCILAPITGINVIDIGRRVEDLILFNDLCGDDDLFVAGGCPTTPDRVEAESRVS